MAHADGRASSQDRNGPLTLFRDGGGGAGGAANDTPGGPDDGRAKRVDCTEELLGAFVPNVRSTGTGHNAQGPPVGRRREKAGGGGGGGGGRVKQGKEGQTGQVWSLG